VTAAEILSLAAFDEGRHAQAFPSFGSERTGAPVVSFCRIDDRDIRTHEPVMNPDALIVQDVTLIHQVDLFSGLSKDCYILINTSRPFSDLGFGDFFVEYRPERLVTCPATDIALEKIGRPLPNAALLGGFAALTGEITLQIEGSKAIAETVALCRPEVVSAYPISPQTHIIEAVGAMVKAGTLKPCEFINVESEFAAMSVAIGASATGARAYTATASQGLLFMTEAVYNAAGLGLPIVMTLANRAIGAPINIWNDHSDAMAVRDSGWIQLFAESNQEAADLHVQAFRLAEELSVPVMVCVDGFILTHAVEGIDLLDQAFVDSFLPPYEPRQVLDPNAPVSIGAMVGPEAFEEVRYLAHLRQLDALERIPAIAQEFFEATGRQSGGLVRPYRLDDAEIVVVAMGSVLGTLKDAVDARRESGELVGVLGVTSFRPFPSDAVRDALARARQVVVLEKAFSIGAGGVLSTDIAIAMHRDETILRTVVAGLGGRAITRRSLEKILDEASRDELAPLTFLDLDRDAVDRERARMQATRRSGPSAENLLRDRRNVSKAVTA
jgi:pyruvate ferredoxin oxidoreductase alpha subunit